MCVIAYKPMNKSFMSKATLEECFRNNPDGAGFMFTADGKVHIRKGFMSFNDFWSALKATRTQYGDKIPYVMHFRISTQAGVNPYCCHPYPLSANMDNLRKLSSSANVGIAHNGIIKLTSDGAKDYNDTMKFITDYVTLLIKKVDWWKNQNVHKALEILCGSKLAILGTDNHVELIGDFIEDKGCYYSNASYKQPKYSYKSYKSFWYDDDWEFYWNKKKGRYDFDDTYCPLVMEGNCSYCECCSHCSKCRTYDLYKDDLYNDYGLDEEDTDIQTIA